MLDGISNNIFVKFKNFTPGVNLTGKIKISQKVKIHTNHTN